MRPHRESKYREIVGESDEEYEDPSEHEEIGDSDHEDQREIDDETISHLSDEEIDVVSVNVMTIEADDPMTRGSSRKSNDDLKQKEKTLIIMKDVSEIKQEISDENPKVRKVSIIR